MKRDGKPLCKICGQRGQQVVLVRKEMVGRTLRDACHFGYSLERQFLHRDRCQQCFCRREQQPAAFGTALLNVPVLAALADDLACWWR